jgi:hypothetical protein
MFRLIYFRLYLAFLLNVFYVLYFNLHLHYHSIFFYPMLYEICLWNNRCRTCTCRTCSKPMRHLFRNDASHMNLWDVWFPNCSLYFGQPENRDHCVLSGVSLVCFFIRDFGSVILLFSDTTISDVWSENSGVMLQQKIHKADTR